MTVSSSAIALPDDPLDGDVTPVPSHRNYLIFCDESGVGGARYYGFGTLWLPYERRGDLCGMVKRLCAAHRYHDGEIKWKKVSRATGLFYRDLMTEFFRCPWLMFHCLIVRKGYVNRTYHDGDIDLARRKHQTMLLAKKVKYFNDGAPDKSYHVRMDPIASRYCKADEVVHKISNYEIEQEAGVAPIASLLEVDSKRSLGIQLCDFLLGATLAAWQEAIQAPHKQAIVELLGEHLGWPDMLADTFPGELKFNIWSFYDPTEKVPREWKTRPVNLKYPMRLFRRRSDVRR